MTLGHGFEDVIDAARLGADWAWSALYKDVFPSLLGYFSAHESPSPRAAARAVFFDLAREIPSFKGDESEFRFLVYGIAYRHVHKVRHGQERQLTRLTDRVLATLDDTACEEPLPDAVRGMLATLSHTQREVILLTLIGGLEIDQVASLVGVGRRRVRSISQRTLARLSRREAVHA